MSEVTAPDYTYTIKLENGSPSWITVRAGRARATILSKVAPCGPEESPAQTIATAILEHHFYATESTSEGSAVERAHRYRKALSRTISARLNRAKHAATLRTAEITNSVFKFVLSPPSDPWEEKYTVPSDSSTRKYTVAKKRSDGSWGCSCPVFKFRHIECKHIEAVQTRPDWYPYQPED